MRYAQMRAIAERTNFRLNFNSEYNRYWLTKESDDEYIALSGKFGRVFDINENINLDCVFEIVNFHPDGRINKTNIYLSNKNNKFYTISTEAQSGYVREFDYKK